MSFVLSKIKKLNFIFWKKETLFTLLIFFSFFVKNLQSQNDEFPEHAIILEAAGIGSYGSLNYERNIFEKKSIRFNTSIGLSTLSVIDFYDKFNPDIIIPIKGMILWNWKTHHLVIGIGQTLSSFPRVNSPNFETKRRNTISASALLGYRWQNPKKRFFIQATYSPIWQQYKRFRHWGGLSFGFSLKKRKQHDK